MNNTPFVVGIVLAVILYLAQIVSRVRAKETRDRRVALVKATREAAIAEEKEMALAAKKKKSMHPKPDTYKVVVDPDSDWHPVLANSKTGEILDKPEWSKHVDPSHVYFGN